MLENKEQLVLQNFETFSDFSDRSAALTLKKASLKQTSPTGCKRLQEHDSDHRIWDGRKVGGYFVQHEESGISNNHARTKEKKGNVHSSASILGCTELARNWVLCVSRLRFRL